MNETPLPRAAAGDLVLGEEPARRIKDEISRHPEIEGFLNTASERLIAITAEVTAGLGIEAVKVAKTRGATAVDAGDVVAAALKLNHPQHAEQVKAWLFGVGGLFIGGAVSATPTLALARSLPHPLIVWGGTIGGLVVNHGSRPPTSRRGLGRGFGSAAQAAVRKGLRRNGSATPCAAHCRCTTRN